MARRDRPRPRGGGALSEATPPLSAAGAGGAGLEERLRAARARARLVLRIERTVPALLPAAAILLAWAALALSGAIAALPAWLAAAVLLAALSGAVRIGAARVGRLAPPGEAETDRRLERASALVHRPLSARTDRPATGGPVAALLWDAQRARAEAALPRLRAGRPRPPVAAADRFRLRFALPALVLAALLAEGPRAGPLLLAALLPGLVEPPGPAGTLAAWITPPGFAGGAPIFLHGGAASLDGLPPGSVLTVSLTGSAARPWLAASAGGARFRRLAAESWQASVALRADQRVRIRQGGHPIADWRFSVTPLAGPAVAWNGAPGAYRGGWRSRLPWRVSDRYGVDRLAARLVPRRPGGAPAIEVPIPLAGTILDGTGAELPDLTASPFAGTEVEARLVAHDVAGRDASSPAVRFVLPQRPFHDPLARAVLDVRRRLALAPGRRAVAAADLRALGGAPGAFDAQPGALLNLLASASLLETDPRPEAVDEAEARLWQLALALEDRSHRGDAAGAGARLALRAARAAVDDQLARMRALGPAGRDAAEQAELRRRIAALGRALAAAVQAMAREAARNGSLLPPDASAQALGGDRMRRMLDRLQAEAGAGRMDEAARQLAQMEDMLDRMREAGPDDVRRAIERMRAARQANAQTEALSDMVRRQAALLDRAQARIASQPPPPPPPDGSEDGAPGAPDGSAGTGADAQGPQGTQGPQPPPEAGTAPATPTQATQPAPDREADGRTERALARAADALSAQSLSLTGKRPAALDAASGAMQRARAKLAAGDDAGAAAGMREALADLQQGGRQMASARARGGEGGALMPGFAADPRGDGRGDGQGDDGAGDRDAGDDGGDPGTADAAGRDPLGRSLAGDGKGVDDSAELALPQDQARRRAREIEEELRRRDTDRERPRQELDYLERLLNGS